MGCGSLHPVDFFRNSKSSGPFAFVVTGYGDKSNTEVQANGAGVVLGKRHELQSKNGVLEHVVAAPQNGLDNYRWA